LDRQPSPATRNPAPRRPKFARKPLHPQRTPCSPLCFFNSWIRRHGIDRTLKVLRPRSSYARNKTAWLAPIFLSFRRDSTTNKCPTAPGKQFSLSSIPQRGSSFISTVPPPGRASPFLRERDQPPGVPRGSTPRAHASIANSNWTLCPDEEHRAKRGCDDLRGEGTAGRIDHARLTVTTTDRARRQDPAGDKRLGEPPAQVAASVRC
jgi:hypothetical protein